jgi:hypothetical protein
MRLLVVAAMAVVPSSLGFWLVGWTLDSDGFVKSCAGSGHSGAGCWRVERSHSGGGVPDGGRGRGRVGMDVHYVERHGNADLSGGFRALRSRPILVPAGEGRGASGFLRQRQDLYSRMRSSQRRWRHACGGRIPCEVLAWLLAARCPAGGCWCRVSRDHLDSSRLCPVALAWQLQRVCPLRTRRRRRHLMSVEGRRQRTGPTGAGAPDWAVPLLAHLRGGDMSLTGRQRGALVRPLSVTVNSTGRRAPRCATTSWPSTWHATRNVPISSKHARPEARPPGTGGDQSADLVRGGAGAAAAASQARGRGLRTGGAWDYASALSGPRRAGTRRVVGHLGLLTSSTCQMWRAAPPPTWVSTGQYVAEVRLLLP